MALTILMFFVLIASYAAMFGLVKFAENVIAKPQAGRGWRRGENRGQRRISLKCRDRIGHAARNATEIAMVSVYVLALLVVLLVIYLFYAVINPEKF